MAKKKNTVPNNNVAAFPNTADLTRLSLTFPENYILDVMERLIEIQQDLKAEGAEMVQIDIVKNATITPRRRASDITEEGEEDMPNIAGGTVDTARARPAPRRASPRRHAADTTIATRQGRNAVVYRVIDPTVHVNPREQEVRMFLLRKGKAMSCADIMAETGLGLKVVQSALWGLRNKKAAESVDDTGNVPQAKFTKAQIKAGAEA